MQPEYQYYQKNKQVNRYAANDGSTDDLLSSKIRVTIA